MSLLVLENLTLDIAGARVLERVSLRVGAGEILGLVGESGSGKSMTALSIFRLLPNGARLAGSVRLGANSLLTLSDREMQAVRGRDIGLVFQEPMTALNPLMTIGDQVAEPAYHHGTATRAAARSLARDALRRVGLPETDFPLTRYPHELSGGQRQRVVIAMAIALRPKLLIADEPTTALDVSTQKDLLDLLEGLAREDGMGLLFISHDLAVIAQIADRVAVMEKGRIVEEGETAHLFGRLAHPYTRALFAASEHVPDRPPPRPREGDPVLRARGLERTYRGGFFGAQKRASPALAGVGFDIFPGEAVGLVGESGSGKSTLARTLLALERPDKGEVSIAGEALSFAGGRSLRALRRRIQIVFQDPYGSFNPRHKVARIVGEPLHLLAARPTAEDLRRRVGEMLERVGLQAQDAGKFPHAFSGGQRQRIAIARALISRPDIVVLDEAVSALDVRTRAQIMDLLAQLSRDMGLAYLFISHDLGVVRAMTDHVLVMHRGRIVEAGPTVEVFAAPRHPYTAELIEASPSIARALAQRGHGD